MPQARFFPNYDENISSQIQEKWKERTCRTNGKDAENAEETTIWKT
jgi:hypothetical protein